MVNIILLSGKQNHRCYYCSNSMIYHDFMSRGPHPPNAMTRDHVIPKSYGGPGLAYNIVIACRQCNGLRGNIHADIFYRLILTWYDRDPNFLYTWHQLDKYDLWRYKMEVLFYQNLHLRSRRRKNSIDFHRYQKFITHHGGYLNKYRSNQVAYPN
jgi:hypothetical protein